MGIVDRDVEPADARERTARHDEVVERDVALAVDRVAVAQDDPLEGHPLGDLVLAGSDVLEHGPEVAGLRLREEADLAEVDAEDRDVDLGHGPDGPQEGAVATEHHERVGRGQLPQQDVDVVGRCMPLRDVAHLAPAGRPRAEFDGRLDRRVVGEADPLDGHAGEPVAVGSSAGGCSGGVVTVAMRPAMSAQPGPGARSTRNSRLPCGPRSGEAMTSRVPRPAAWARSTIAFEDLAVDRRVADDAVIRPAAARLELRLDERHDVSPMGERGDHRREDELERDERDVDRGKRDRLGKRRRGQGARVRALHRDDARVASQRFGELPASHVESVDAGRTALQEDVGEAAGRGADVEAHEPARVDPEGIERGGELVAAPADEGLGLVHIDVGGRRDQVAGLAVVTGGVALPHPDLAGQHERLRAAARLDQPALHEQLVEADPRGLRSGRRAVARTHPPIVAQPASPGLTSTRPARSWGRRRVLRFCV